MNKPHILILDIETRPMEAYVWGRKDVNIGLGALKRDWNIMAWSAKWLGDKKVCYRDMRYYETDCEILYPLREMLNVADIVITQNGQSFDSRKINARLLYYQIPPPSPYKHMDTYRIARKVGAFTSYSLEYLCEYLNTKHQKLKHSKFPGWSLWTECIKGNLKAWEEMRRYNINDTLATEDLYMKLRAWAPSWVYAEATACRMCGDKANMWHKGYEIKKSGRYNRYQCQSCFAWTTGGKE